MGKTMGVGILPDASSGGSDSFSGRQQEGMQQLLLGSLRTAEGKEEEKVRSAEGVYAGQSFAPIDCFHYASPRDAPAGIRVNRSETTSPDSTIALHTPQGPIPSLTGASTGDPVSGSGSGLGLGLGLGPGLLRGAGSLRGTRETEGSAKRSNS